MKTFEYHNQPDLRRLVKKYESNGCPYHVLCKLPFNLTNPQLGVLEELSQILKEKGSNLVLIADPNSISYMILRSKTDPKSNTDPWPCEVYTTEQAAAEKLHLRAH